jgi:hypothetical protein
VMMMRSKPLADNHIQLAVIDMAGTSVADDGLVVRDAGATPIVDSVAEFADLLRQGRAGKKDV